MRCFLLGLGLSSVACGSAAPDFELIESALADDQGTPLSLPNVSPTCPPGALRCVNGLPIYPRNGVAELCSGELQVGYVQNVAACPAAGSSSTGIWRGGALFALGSFTADPALTLSSSGSPPLGAWCVYEWFPGSAGAVPDLSALPADGPLAASTWLEPDCAVVVPLGGAGDLTWRSLRTRMRRQVAAPSSLAQGPHGAATVQVAVVDSSPSRAQRGEPTEGQLAHGFAVGRMIRDIACPSGHCAASVRSHLGLPRVSRTQVDRRRGGYFGYQSELAREIVASVAQWERDRAAAAPPELERLIINLSLGWEPQFGGNFAGSASQSLRNSARAVHDAIDFARCMGALVIAAAGNDSGGDPPVRGPMFPGGWERKQHRCSGSGYSPLVYAAGGVDASDRPIPIARPGGMPRLVAYAQNVSTEDPRQRGEHTPALTGTSMAAAAVSAAASVIWGYRPALSGDAVMDLLYGSGTALPGQRADFCLEGDPGCDPRSKRGLFPQRRLSLCNALSRACQGQPGLCPASLPRCATPTAQSAPPAAVSSLTLAQLDALVARNEEIFLRDVRVASLPRDPCGAPVHYAPGGTLPQHACPFDQAPGKAWGAVGPQPGEDPCGECLLAPDSLFIEIAEDFPDQFRDQVLTLWKGPDPVPYASFWLGDALGPLKAGFIRKVYGLPPAELQWAEAATLSGMVETPGKPPTSAMSVMLMAK